MIIRSPLADQLLSIYQQQLDFPPRSSDCPGELSSSELETLLGVGILIFQSIRRRYLAWYVEVDAKRIAYNVEDAQALADQYQQWQDRTEYWLVHVERFARAGHKVNRAAEIRRLYDELKLVELDARGLMRRFQELREGKGIEAPEFFAALRKRNSS